VKFENNFKAEGFAGIFGQFLYESEIKILIPGLFPYILSIAHSKWNHKEEI
jgi:hypothetical protein